MSFRALPLVLLVLVAVPSLDARAAGVKLESAKVVSIGLQGDGFSPGVDTLDVSSNGRYLAFASNASNVMAGVDPGGMQQIYWRDLKTGATRLVSQDVAGNPADGYCSSPTISDNGLRVGFMASGFDFGLGDNGQTHVYFADLFAGTLRVASKTLGGILADGGSYGPSISGDGRFLAFYSNANNLTPLTSFGPQVFVYDAAADSWTYASLTDTGTFANAGCYSPALSRSGRFVAYLTTATNVPAVGASALQKVVVYDRTLGVPELVSVSSAGIPGDSHCYVPAITPDGRRVAFLSYSSNLVPGSPSPPKLDAYVFDRNQDSIVRIATKFGPSVSESPMSLSVSEDGNRLAVTTTFLPGGAIIPVERGHAYDRAKNKHLVVGIGEAISQSSNDEITSLRLAKNGEQLFFVSGSSTFDLEGSGYPQALRVSLGGW